MSNFQVKVLVNGNPIPFNMKIGEAGEAFFVFETDDDDLPDDLITSPLLEATQLSQGDSDVQHGRFGTKEDEERRSDNEIDTQDALVVSPQH